MNEICKRCPTDTHLHELIVIMLYSVCFKLICCVTTLVSSLRLVYRDCKCCSYTISSPPSPLSLSSSSSSESNFVPLNSINEIKPTNGDVGKGLLIGGFSLDELEYVIDDTLYALYSSIMPVLVLGVDDKDRMVHELITPDTLASRDHELPNRDYSMSCGFVYFSGFEQKEISTVIKSIKQAMLARCRGNDSIKKVVFGVAVNNAMNKRFCRLYEEIMSDSISNG